MSSRQVALLGSLACAGLAVCVYISTYSTPTVRDANVATRNGAYLLCCEVHARNAADSAVPLNSLGPSAGTDWRSIPWSHRPTAEFVAWMPNYHAVFSTTWVGRLRPVLDVRMGEFGAVASAVARQKRDSPDLSWALYVVTENGCRPIHRDGRPHARPERSCPPPTSD